MSLLSQFQKIKMLMQNDYDSVNYIYSGDIKHLFEHQNQWRAKKYPKSGLTTTTVPDKSSITTIPPNAVTYRATSDRSYDWRWGDDYVGYMELYLYCNQAKTFSFTYTTDDTGQIWLNDTTLGAGASTSCTAKTVTGNFKKGLNHLEIMWCERSGGDGGCTNQTWQNLDWVDWCYGNYIGK